jgi:small subunit ribosomal protein S1
MGNRELVKRLCMKDEEIERRVQELLRTHDESIQRLYTALLKELQPESILKGKIVGVAQEYVFVDVGHKSEGIVPKEEFAEPEQIKIGQELEVFLEQVREEDDVLILSKQKADRVRGWERIVTYNKEGDVLRGKVTRKVKGGVLVDAGISVFLPTSLADIRKLDDVDELIGKEVECTIIKIDQDRMNVIVSRKKFLEDQREQLRVKLLSELREGDIRTGVVKNIADYGVFIDLGGVDGLLHITDMSWGHVSHPSELFAVGQELKVKVLSVERESGRIALGLKQLTRNPWEDVAQRYPVGTRVKGRVTNIMPYGAFVELEPGLEGLIHVSEMSWIRRINHPSEVLSIGETVEAVMLSVDPDRQELALGLKQAQPNPWETAKERYQVGSRLSGKVRHLTTFGAFIELEDGIEGLLHANDISWTKKLVNPIEMFKRGERLEVMVLAVDPEKHRIALGLKQLKPNPWETTIPERYSVGSVVTGKVTKLVQFGAFIELEDDLEGLLHLPKAKDGVALPSPVKAGDKVEVKVVKLEPKEGKIRLTLTRVLESYSEPR